MIMVMMVTKMMAMLTIMMMMMVMMMDNPVAGMVMISPLRHRYIIAIVVLPRCESIF